MKIGVWIIGILLVGMVFAEQYQPPTVDTIQIQQQMLLIELNQRVENQKAEISNLKRDIQLLQNHTMLSSMKIERMQEQIINNQKKDYLLIGIVSLTSGLIGYIIAFLTMRKLYLYSPIKALKDLQDRKV